MSFKAVAYGKYFLLDKIATGGMAEVFKAKSFGVSGFERLLVIKRILPHLTRDREFVEMFIDEAKIAVQLTHANIAQVFDLGKIGNNYFIAMECVEGKDLRAILKKCHVVKSRLEISQAVGIAIEVLKGLDYAHRKLDGRTNEPLNIIHRDISPQNVMISYEGQVKIVDFGIAKAEKRINETQAGVLKGKFGYMSPEQATGLECDGRTDIFSTGIILYEMLTGRRLFMGDNDLETLDLIREASVPSPTKYNKDIPPELETIVYKALQKDAEERYLDARQMQVDLTRFLYASHPEYTSSDLSLFVKQLFDQEIEVERDRLEKAISKIPLAAMAKDETTDPEPNIAEAKGVSLISQDDRVEVSVADYTLDGPLGSQAPWSGDGAETAHQSRQAGSAGLSAIDVNAGGYPLSSGTSLIDSFKPWVIPGILLTAIVSLVYWNFFRNDEIDVAQPQASPTAAVVAKGQIEVMTEPAGAQVLVNGELKGQSPATVELDAGKDYAFSFQREGFEDKVMTIYIQEGANAPLNVYMQPAKALYASLRVSSAPTGALIYLNGEETNKRTPYTFDQLLRNKTYAIKLHKRGYKSAETSLFLDTAEAEKKVQLAAQRGMLSVESDPAGASVIINGKDVGRTPFQKRFKMFDSVKVTLKKEGYKPASKKLTMRKARENINIVLAKAVVEYGYVSINVEPWGMVYIDGKLIGSTPILSHKVPVGKRTIEFSHPDYPPRQQRFAVKKENTPDNPAKIIIDLTQSQ